MDQSSNVFARFLDALKKTEQQHVYEVIVVRSYTGKTKKNYVYVDDAYTRILAGKHSLIM